MKVKMANPAESSSQSEEYSSKWLIWLLCREPLYYCRPLLNYYVLDIIILAEHDTFTMITCLCYYRLITVV